MAKIIGMKSRGVRYKRMSMQLGTLNYYFLMLYLGVCLLLWWAGGLLPLLPFVALMLFGVNQRVIRIADDQSVIILFVTTVTMHVLSAPPEIVGWIALWLAVSPLPLMLGIAPGSEGMKIADVTHHAPFDHSNIEKGFNEFFSAVPSGSRIYFAFNNPADVYEKIFDGYRATIELPLFVVARREIHLFPDWHAVAETNYPGAPNCWGRELLEVLENIGSWNAQFILYYGERNTIFSDEWKQYFDVISSFDWADYHAELRGVKLWNVSLPTPVFFLLRYRKGLETTIDER